MEPIGWGKMEALSIKHLFTQPPFGGFGSDFCSGNTAESWRDRGEFVRIAARKAAAVVQGGQPLPLHDVQCTCRCVCSSQLHCLLS